MMLQQRQAERHVFMLLHRVRFAHELPDAPFADAICRATGAPNAVEAFARVVEDAIPGDGETAAKLRGVILNVDFRSGATNLECARSMHLSKRHFQRLRAEAVTQIARYVQSVVGPSALEERARANRAAAGRAAGDESSPAAQIRALRAATELGTELNAASLPRATALAAGLVANFVAYSREINGRDPGDPPRGGDQRRYDARTRFEMERLAFLRARDRGRAFEMKTISASLVRLADDPRTTVTALCARAESLLRLGKLDEAEADLARLEPSMQEDGDPALRLEATVVHAQLALAFGDAERAEELARAVHAVVDPRHRDSARALEIVSAARLRRSRSWQPPSERVDRACRHDRAVVDAERVRHLTAREPYLASRLARQVYDYAAPRDLDGLAARAAASLGWTGRAIAHVLRTQDALLASNLSLQQPDRAAAAPILHQRLAVIVPQMAGDGASAKAAVAAFVAAMLGGEKPPALRAAARAVVRSGSALAPYGAGAAACIESAFALALAALGGAPMTAAARATLQNILFTMSHGSGAEHLRLDDGSAAADAADICVRSFPPRPVA